MAQHKIILDCDPGIDDAVAILLALASPEEIELVGITTVSGNVSLERTSYNARRICTLASREDIPVYAGCARPMLEAECIHTTVHGNDGLGNVKLPQPAFSLEPQHAVDFIIHTLHAEPGQITLCPIGPMTNIALAIIKDPTIVPKIKRLVFMGGAAFCPGNVSPTAEFNIYVDPWAAHVVLSAGIPQVMFGLDVTLQAKINAPYLDALEQVNPLLKTATAMLRNYGVSDPCLHDPCVIAWLIDPSLFTGITGKISVSYQDDQHRGQTLVAVKPRHLDDDSTNIDVMTEVDNPRLLEMLAERLSRL
ncbi:nucleoside hydrolase [Rouxiella badensis]|uniref:nucleoside hydrolase n=1 Tax=Rouxiella badensis TaxID=1646377 RepID=UPI001D1396EE|nr:nucleoside hydrolase [Rouxiella badensis]MCC3733275.1 nucleoside hydrolase [Rouxiella badensis]MCC3758074.1 nucleoside hydrolase [Rouxiella badensis]